MKSLAKQGSRNASKLRKRKADALATRDKYDGPAYLPSEKRNVVASLPKIRLSNKLKTRDTAHVLRHTGIDSMDRRHIEDEENRGQDRQRMQRNYWLIFVRIVNMPRTLKLCEVMRTGKSEAIKEKYQRQWD